MGWIDLVPDKNRGRTGGEATGWMYGALGESRVDAVFIAAP